MEDPLNNFSFQPVFHDWCKKCRGMCYPVCRMMQIKQPLLLIGKSSPCGGSGFHLSLSAWSFNICVTPYNRKENVLSASLKHFLPSLPQVENSPVFLLFVPRNVKSWIDMMGIE